MLLFNYHETNHENFNWIVKYLIFSYLNIFLYSFNFSSLFSFLSHIKPETYNLKFLKKLEFDLAGGRQ